MKENKSFCVLPFIHLATHPIGTITPCCITDMDGDVSSAIDGDKKLFLGTDSLSDIANSERFTKVRSQMIKGEYPKMCKICQHHDENDIYSKRKESNEKFKHLIDDAVLNTKENGELVNVNYKYIELRLGSVCNLKCITCNPFSSNRWNEDVKIFKGTEFEKQYFKNDDKTDWYRSTEFYDDLIKHTPELEEVWINGGEPTLIKEHSYFLQRLIDNDIAKNIDLHYSINLTRIPDTFIDIWKQFKKVRLSLSIDDLGDRNDYIRTGSSWSVIYKNLQKILEYRDTFSLEICQTVSMLNVYELNEFKKFTDEHEVVLSHNYVNYPSFLHVSNIPTEMKEEILNNIPDLHEWEIERLKDELFKNATSELEKFYTYINMLDLKRNVNISESLSEWAKYFIK